MIGASHNNFLMAVTAIIDNLENEILLIKRSQESSELPNCWVDIGGKLPTNELPERGLRREIFVETGLINIGIIKPLTLFHTFLSS